MQEQALASMCTLCKCEEIHVAEILTNSQCSYICGSGISPFLSCVLVPSHPGPD